MGIQRNNQEVLKRMYGIQVSRESGVNFNVTHEYLVWQIQGQIARVDALSCLSQEERV